MPAVRALSFDLFGTLLDLDVWGAEVRFVGQLAKRRGLHVEPRALVERWLSHSVALRRNGAKFLTIKESLVKGAALSFEEQGVHDDPEPWAAELLRFWADRPLFPEVLPVLESLAARHRLCLVTNVDEAVLQQILTRRGLSSWFAFALSSERCQCYKPSERIFRTAVLHLGVPASDIVHVGDSLDEDVLPATKVGMRTVHVDRKGEAAGGDVRPTATIRDLAGLPAVLPRL